MTSHFIIFRYSVPNLLVFFALRSKLSLHKSNGSLRFWPSFVERIGTVSKKMNAQRFHYFFQFAEFSIKIDTMQKRSTTNRKNQEEIQLKISHLYVRFFFIFHIFLSWVDCHFSLSSLFFYTRPLFHILQSRPKIKQAQFLSFSLYTIGLVIETQIRSG